MNRLSNMDIRLRAREKGVPLWRVAQSIGVSEQTLLRWLRVNLDPERRENIVSAIDYLAGGEQNG